MSREGRVRPFALDPGLEQSPARADQSEGGVRSPMEQYAATGHPGPMMQHNGAPAAIQLAKNPLESLRFPAEDGGQSLAAWARRDLEATLQLLADRAQYITGGTGAAIALRDGDFIMCRASSGPSAPRVGSYFEVSSGLSGESVRTRKMLRCDDASTDSRVNFDSCKALGIASFAVMPLIRHEEVIGIFEIFSNKARAFQERDLLALERMGEMVNTALDQVKSRKGKADATESEVNSVGMRSADSHAGLAPAPNPETLTPDSESSHATSAGPPDTVVDNALQIDHSLLFGESAVAATPAVPAQPAVTVNGIGTCTACGFPVSGGRKLCLDCEASVPKQPPIAPASASGAPAFLAGLEGEKVGFWHWIVTHRYLLGTIAMGLATLLVLLLHW